jgi:hypothetical protein
MCAGSPRSTPKFGPKFGGSANFVPPHHLLTSGGNIALLRKAFELFHLDEAI